MSQLSSISRQLRLRGADQRILLRQAKRIAPPGTKSFADAVSAEGSAKEREGEQTVSSSREACLFVDSVFPVRLGTLDFRYYIGVLREETLLSRLSTLLNGVNVHGFKPKSLEPHHKDGGVFVKFVYEPGSSEEAALNDIIEELRRNAAQHGGIPSWTGISLGNVWLVKGTPWREDMNHYASPIVRVSFEGPDLREETLYELLRPFGRITDIAPPTPPPAGTLRSATVTFRQIRAATVARNTIHGLAIPPDASSTTLTRVRTKYQQPIQAHVIRDYISSHPKIFLPIFIFLLGSLTYTVFDPIRVLMVEGKLNNWFDYRQYQFYKWIRSNTIDRFYVDPEAEKANNATPIVSSAWKEREDALGSLQRYLSDIPNTVTFLHGPQGSGKSRMLAAILKDTKRKALVIDVGALAQAGSDAALVSALAEQTGYWPVFSFLNSMNNMIDLASVGLIGQKAGLSSSLSDQLKQVLDVVGTGLRAVNTSHRKQRERELKEEKVAKLMAEEEERIKERIKNGIWHDPRLDCIAGNGIMSELGVGDEWLGAADADGQPAIPASTPVVAAERADKGDAEKEKEAKEKEEPKEVKKEQPSEDLQAVEAMPIVILKGFDSKGGGARREELLNVISQWAASLAEGHVAHVIVVSDNRENAKLLAKALPSKPLTLIPLSDADSGSALSFLKQKLHDMDVEVDFTPQQIAYIDRLGGRASDLESLMHKVRSGMTVEDAVNDIITRGVSELRKNAFGDDAEDAKNLAWSREQAWAIMKQLAKRSEIPYHDVLMDFPFKGDETPLREMEHSELIAITTHDGRPSTIRPGKPVYKYVFEKLVQDPIFQATQDIAYNQKIIASNEATIKACEDELMTLKEVEAGTSHWWGSRKAVSSRGEYLLKKMRAAVEKIEALERQNATLKKVLAKAH